MREAMLEKAMEEVVIACAFFVLLQFCLWLWIMYQTGKRLVALEKHVGIHRDGAKQ